MNKVSPIIEISIVIQGEGRFAGTLAILVRMTGCPLRCIFGKNKCDSSYASWNPEKGIHSVNEVVTVIKQNRNINNLIITGGEPLMSESTVDKLLHAANVYGMNVTIETSGAYAFNSFEYLSKYRKLQILVSISPKMSNSVPTIADGVSEDDIKRHNRLRCNYEAIANTIASSVVSPFGGFQLKFVISTLYDIDSVDSFCHELHINGSDVYLMPEGITKDEIDSKRAWMINQCILRGYNYSDRLHILAFNDKRGV